MRFDAPDAAQVTPAFCDTCSTERQGMFQKTTRSQAAPPETTSAARAPSIENDLIVPPALTGRPTLESS